MSKIKLTLTVDSGVVARAKRYAKQRSVSVSKIVETYLAEVSEPSPATAGEATPVLRSVRGILKSGNLSDYRRHVSAKRRSRVKTAS
jgi:hypothetical protein